MNPYPGPRSVLVLDNASIHHSRRFSTMMHAKGFIVLYTPPCCFNLTPLDNGAFGLLKRYLRHHYFQGTMADKMDNAFKNAVSDRAARRFFRECGYGPLM